MRYQFAICISIIKKMHCEQDVHHGLPGLSLRGKKLKDSQIILHNDC